MKDHNAAEELLSTHRRFALLVEYDGTDYVGWQWQPNGISVQQRLEEAVSAITGAACTVVGSGRTDAGVHGFGQVAHVDVPASCRIPVEKAARAFNAGLPPDIRIREVRHAPNHFHARFDAVRREYRYRIALQASVFRHQYVWQPNINAATFNAAQLQACADVFVGEHDFTTFSKLNTDTERYVCRVERAVWNDIPINTRTTTGTANDAVLYELSIAADRYVYGMVRSLVGTMMDVALGKRGLDDVADALRSCDRSRNSTLAPACGLTLWRVEYPEPLFGADLPS
jgi:tRNA pseudouridine38-40 synthase